MSATEIEYQPSNSKASKFTASLQATRKFCHNPDDGTCCGRTGASWGKICVFYMVFYSVLAGFCAVMLTLFFQTLNDTRPNQVGMQSLIKGNPGMAFRPMPKVSSTLIKFEQGQEETYRKYVDNIKVLLYKYTQEQKDGDYQDCKAGRNEDDERPCKFDLDHYFKDSGCNEVTHFGYFEGQPCILLKLNKIFEWEPEVYGANDTLPKELADTMTAPEYDGTGVSITCIGENFGDEDNLGLVEFFPSQGFLNDFFPFVGQKGYQAPLVFARMRGIVPGVAVQVYCKAWAKNIYHHKNDKAGSLHFEIMYD